MIRGTLIRNENKTWMVKWSDLHSFGQGTHWTYTQLSDDSNSIIFVQDNEIKYKELKENEEVQFEIIQNQDNQYQAKLIFPQVEKFQTEEYLKKFILENNKPFFISQIDTMRDGGTIAISCSNQSKFYIHKDNNTIHSQYPTINENKITNIELQVYILDRLENYKNNCQIKLTKLKETIPKINLNIRESFK